VSATSDLGQGASAGDVRRIRLRRHGREYTVNLVRYIDSGDKRNNPVLLPDDLIIVPENSFNKIYTFGEIDNTVVQLTGAPKTLVEVLAELGGIDRVRADARGIFVFRRNEPFQQAFDVYQFDLSNAASLILAADFIMAPLDIIFVTNNPPTRWSDTISTLLQPFNSILTAQITVNNLEGN
jgi:polysaccharide export outer membrane protein